MDRRIVKTRHTIEVAFRELLAQKGYAAMSVADILEAANVGKSTFYAHYHSKEDVLQELMGSICEHVLNSTGPESVHDFSASKDTASLVEHLLCHLQERDSDIHALVLSDAAGAFDYQLRMCVITFFDTLMPEQPQGVSRFVERTFVVRHLSGAFIQMLMDWARACFEQKPSQLARDFAFLAEPLLV